MCARRERERERESVRCPVVRGRSLLPPFDRWWWWWFSGREQGARAPEVFLSGPHTDPGVLRSTSVFWRPQERPGPTHTLFWKVVVVLESRAPACCFSQIISPFPPAPPLSSTPCPPPPSPPRTCVRSKSTERASPPASRAARQPPALLRARNWGAHRHTPSPSFLPRPPFQHAFHRRRSRSAGPGRRPGSW